MKSEGPLPLLLVTSGLLAVLALSFPTLIAWGYLLILPGIVLTIAPSAFVYLCLFAIGWYSTKRFGSGTAIVAGLAIVGALGIVPAKIINARAAKDIAEAKLKAVEPSASISIPRDVTILQPAYKSRYSNIDFHENTCDDLCLAILYGGNARSVTMGTSSISEHHLKYRGRVPAITYSIERSPACTTKRLSEMAHWQGWKTDETFYRLLAAVKVKIADGDCLVARPATHPKAGVQLVFDESSGIEGEGRATNLKIAPVVRTLEIRRDGELQARSVDVEATELDVPLLLLPEGNFFSQSWRFKRRQYSSAEPINSVERLRDLVGWPSRFPTAELATSFRDQIDNDPFAHESGILVRAHRTAAIKTTGKDIAIGCPATTLEPCGRLPRASAVISNCTGRPVFCWMTRARFQISDPAIRSPILSFTRSQPRSLHRWRGRTARDRGPLLSVEEESDRPDLLLGEWSLRPDGLSSIPRRAVVHRRV